MRLENQVCTFEQANKLAGHFRLESLFAYYVNQTTKENGVALTTILESNPRNGDILYPAYTVAELGFVLWWINIIKIEIDVSRKCFHLYNIYLEYYIKRNIENEAQARAEALIWLIENNLIKVEDFKL